MDDIGRHYNPPPAPPRERMWARIAAARAARAPRRPWRRVWALAAVLAVGMVVGRLGFRDAPVPPPPACSPGPTCC